MTTSPSISTANTSPDHLTPSLALACCAASLNTCPTQRSPTSRTTRDRRKSFGLRAAIETAATLERAGDAKPVVDAILKHFGSWTQLRDDAPRDLSRGMARMLRFAT